MEIINIENMAFDATISLLLTFTIPCARTTDVSMSLMFNISMAQISM